MRSTLRYTRLAFVAAISTTMLFSAPAARAELVATQQLAASASQTPGAARQTLDRFVARADVQRKLQAMGLSRDVTAQRLAALSDAEVADLATRIGAMPAAGNIGFQEMVIILLVAILVAVAV